MKVTSASSVRKLFLERGIRFKNVRLRRLPPPNRTHYQVVQDQRRLGHEMRYYMHHGYECVFIDECCFTWRGYSKKGWSHKFMNMTLAQTTPHHGVNCVAVVGAISSEHGKEHFQYVNKSFDGEQFRRYFCELARHMKQRKWVAFLDNCSIHRGPVMKQLARTLNVPLVWNVAYAPEFNGIENFWAAAKRTYKKLGVDAMLHGRRRDLMQEARVAVS